MRVNSKLIKGICIFLVLSFIPIQAIASYDFTIYFIYALERKEPIIDGIIEGSPWSYNFRGIRLYNQSDSTDYIDISIKALHNDTTKTVTIGLKIPTTNSDDILRITFRKNYSALDSFVAFGEPWRFSKGNDQKVFHLLQDVKTDCHTNGVDLESVADTSVGGTNDFYGQAIHDGTHYVVEMGFTQNSGDTVGYDIDLETKNNTQFFLWYYDHDTQTTYSLIEVEDGSKDSCHLMLSGRRKTITITLNAISIIGSLIGTLLVTTYIIRRRRVTKLN